MRIPVGLVVDRIDVSPIRFGGSDVLGWEAYLYEPNCITPAGGGFGYNQDVARIISIAEAIERFLVRKIGSDSDDELFMKFCLLQNPSSSGFAFGVNSQSSAFRSLCEGYEHFVRYYGVYCGLKLAEVPLSLFPQINKQDKLCLSLMSMFRRIRFLLKEDDVGLDGYKVKLYCLVLICETDEGVFVGAKCAQSVNDLLVHALIEVWRNLRIVNKELDEKFIGAVSSTRLRNIYCGSNKLVTLDSLNKSSSEWPEPEVVLFETCYFESCHGYLSRALFAGVPPWSSLSREKLI